METVFKDAFYGGLAGTLVGGALLLFQDNPGDNLEYLAYGMGTGIILGTVYGFASVTRPLVEIEKDRIYVNFPSIDTEIYTVDPGRKEIIHSLNLIRYNF